MYSFITTMQSPNPTIAFELAFEKITGFKMLQQILVNTISLSSVTDLALFLSDDEMDEAGR